MRIYYGLTRDGKHIIANIPLAYGSLTPTERRLLLEVFSTLCAERTAESVLVTPPKHVGDYVLVRVGVSEGKNFAEYISRGAG